MLVFIYLVPNAYIRYTECTNMVKGSRSNSVHLLSNFECANM